MKNIILLFLIASPVIINAQTPFSTDTISKSIVIQKVDSVQSGKIMDIENRLASFHDTSRTSQFLLITGGLIYLAGTYHFKPDNKGINPFTVIGGGMFLIGTVISFDSYRYLNMRKKIPIKKSKK